MKKTGFNILKTIAVLIVLLTGRTSYATAPYTYTDSATAAYKKGEYAKAATFYQQFVSSGYESPDIYYNLGNCYYKTNDIAKAILYYEKAKRLAPADADIQFNLQLATQKTTDKIPSDNEIFLVSWWDNFVNMASERGWAIICIIFLCTALGLVILYLLSQSVLLKQLGFWLGALMFLSCLFAFILARQQYTKATTHDTAIVMSASVTVKGSPVDNATQLFVIHEGTKLKIIKTEGTWTEVKLSNGNQGWLLSSDIAAI
jgi:tetratricopeptide (TPR) repeat protein